MANRYKNPDNNPRGIWKAGDLSIKTYNESTDYSITTPSGRIVNPPSGYCWRVSKKKLQEMIADNRIWFDPKGNSGTSALKWGTGKDALRGAAQKGYRRRAGRHVQSRWLEWRWEIGVSSNGDLRRGDKTDMREP